MSIYRVFSEKSTKYLVRQITELKNNPNTLTVFLCLNFYLSTTVGALFEWQKTAGKIQ